MPLEPYKGALAGETSPTPAPAGSVTSTGLQPYKGALEKPSEGWKLPASLQLAGERMKLAHEINTEFATDILKEAGSGLDAAWNMVVPTIFGAASTAWELGKNMRDNMRPHTDGAKAVTREQKQAALQQGAAVGEDLSNPIMGENGVLDVLGLRPKTQTTISKIEKGVGGVLEKGVDMTGEGWEGLTRGVLQKEDIQILYSFAFAKEAAGGVKRGVTGEKLLPSNGPIAQFLRKDIPWFTDSVKAKKAAGVPEPEVAAAKDMDWSAVRPEDREQVKQQVVDHFTEKAKAEERGEAPKPGGMPESEPIDIPTVEAIKAKPNSLRTPEERLQLRRWDEAQAKDPGWEKARTAAGKPGFLRTAEDKAYLAKYGKLAAAAGLGVAFWDQLNEKDRDEALPSVATGLGLMGLHQIGRAEPSTPLGVLLEKRAGTLLTLERLPKNRFEFTKQMIEQEMRRADVTDAERAVLQNALVLHGDKITARDLLDGVDHELRDLQLNSKTTPEYGDYGLGALDRELSPDPAHFADGDWMPEPTPGRIQLKPESAFSTVYQLPRLAEFDLENPPSHHYPDPQYFAHTRTFIEDGIPHVVEIQSDFTQGKLADKMGLRKVDRELKELSERLQDALKYGIEGDDIVYAVRESATFKAGEHIHLGLLESLRQFANDIGTPGKDYSFNPALLDRLMRENPETGATLKEEMRRAIVYLQDLTRQEAPSPRPIEHLPSLFKHWMKRIVREELRSQHLFGEAKAVRFATAETVAKVEGWQRRPQGVHNHPAWVAITEALDEAARRQTAAMRAVDRDPHNTTLRLEEIALAHEVNKLYEQRADLYSRLAATAPIGFSDAHQGIFDRYKKDAEKFYRQLGGTLVADSKGHTWWEVPASNAKMNVGPRTQQFGKGDPMLLGVMAGAMIGGVLGYEAYHEDHPVAGTVTGILAGLAAAKHGPAIAEAVKDRLKGSDPVKAAVKELTTKLYTLGQGAAYRGLEILQHLKDTMPKDYGKHAEEIYKHLDDPKNNPISPRAKEILDQTIRPIQEANKAMLGMLDKLGIHTAELLDDYGFHRIPKGQRKGFWEAIGRGSYPYSKGFSTTAPSAMERGVWQYTTDSGKSLIGITGKDGRVSLYDGQKVILKGSWDAKKGELRAGGESYSRGRATIADIEKHTKLEYHKEPLLGELDANIRLSQALNNAYFLRDLKNMPGFDALGMKLEKGKSIPAGWKRVEGVPQLRDMYFEPRIAEALEDFAGDPRMKGDKFLNKVNRVLVGSLFWNPLPHVANVALHALQAKGLVGLTMNLPTNVRSLFEAYKEVSDNGPKYRAYLRQGGAFMYPDRILGDFNQKVLTTLGQKPEGTAIARAFGYHDAPDMISRLYNASADSLWKWNDVFMMQSYLEMEARGMTREKAMRDTERHIPDYKIPPRVLGARELNRIMTDPKILTFARYDFGRLKSYAATVGDLLGKDKTLGERAHALDQLAMLGVIMLAYDQLADPIARWVTGNENAKAIRFGPATIPQLMMDAWNGEADRDAPALRAFHLSPVAELLPQVMHNKNSFTGKPFVQNPKDIPLAMASQLSPVHQMAQVDEGRADPRNVFWNAIGINVPTEQDVARKEKRKEKRLADREKEGEPK